MDWDKLRVFHAVAEAGSFTHAGERLNLSQSAVSRQIGALEESLSAPLFHRHARGLILTEQGELLLDTAREVFAKLSQAEAMLTDSKETARGPLTVTATVAFGSTWLTPRIREFLQLYPDVELSLLIGDEELDLGMRQADVAIRMTPPRQPDLIQRHLMTVRLHIYGAVDYLKRRGIPKSLDDLSGHNLIIFGNETRAPIDNVNWLTNIGDPKPGERRPVLRINNQYAIYRAVRSGLGLASLPDYMVDPNLNVVKVLPDVAGPAAEAYFVYPEELRRSKRIQVFRDFLVRKIAESRF
ncbi:MAG: LysR family transcriptional regulator [Inquilinus sp.]|nr:LysR family transcriptional regulator [Inquilinus sp.]